MNPKPQEKDKRATNHPTQRHWHEMNRKMRTYWRQRNDLVRSAGRHILRMQKALTQMNLQLANVLSDVSGATGQAIIKAILAGERNAHKLAEFRDPRVKASEEQIA
jgi:transposase